MLNVQARGVEYFFLLRQVCNKGGCDSLHNPIPSFVASLLSGRGGCHVVNHVHVNHFRRGWVCLTSTCVTQWSSEQKMTDPAMMVRRSVWIL